MISFLVGKLRKKNSFDPLEVSLLFQLLKRRKIHEKKLVKQIGENIRMTLL